MRIAMYPFASGADVGKNLQVMLRAMELAATQGAELLVFHECALCGYPPIECDMRKMDWAQLDDALERVAQRAAQLELRTAVGTARREAGKRYNSVILFDADGSRMGQYDKTALWGWDEENFAPGSQPGLFDIGGLRVGFRICFDVRFPEVFRPLFDAQADLCVVCFSDTSAAPDPERMEIIRAHLRTRAVENVMTVASVNSLSRCPTAPTAVFDPDGRVRCEQVGEGLLVCDVENTELDFGRRGRRVNRERLPGLRQS
ncbi:MAG: carbon-nitrogen hydrolase family protein [Candidatus Spyradocola sp.]